MFKETNERKSKPEGTFVDPQKIENNVIEVEHTPEEEGEYPEITKFYDNAPEPVAPPVRVKPMSKRPPKPKYDPKAIVLHKPSGPFGTIRE